MEVAGDWLSAWSSSDDVGDGTNNNVVGKSNEYSSNQLLALALESTGDGVRGDEGRGGGGARAPNAEISSDVVAFLNAAGGD
jgi:hypothetical protein